MRTPDKSFPYNAKQPVALSTAWNPQGDTCRNLQVHIKNAPAVSYVQIITPARLSFGTDEVEGSAIHG